MGLAALCLALPGCSLIFGGDQRVDAKSHDYAIVRLDHETGGKWHMLSSSQKDPDAGDFAFEHEQTGTIISLNSVCREYRNASLQDLTHNLLLGLDTKGEAETRDLTLDGVPALESTVEAGMGARHPSGDLKGYPVRVRAVVLKKNGCTFDFMYVAQAEHFEADLGDFDRFLKGFHVN